MNNNLAVQNASRLLHLKSQLGIFPISLMHNQLNNGKFALLNGHKNSLCIDFLNDLTEEEYRSYAWSANINNFLSVNNDSAYLHNITRRGVETIPYKVIESNLPKFYDYLGQKNINDELNIVRFILRTYRQLRNTLREGSGQDSLRAFLYLLANVDEDNVDINKWGLADESLAIKNSINNAIWEGFVEEIKTGLSIENLRPNISLILRHTAGRLFEEANYIAQFPAQLDLFPSELIKYDYHPKQLGAFYTPSYVARTIVEESFLSRDVLPDRIRIFDPACGAGEFLVEALRQLKTRGYTGQVEVIGWDIAPTALDMANYVLVFEKREWGENLIITLENKDSISTEWPKGMDFIFMNPPYASWVQMDNETRDKILKIIELRNGRPNLAAVFYLMATQSLSANGVLGCMIPSSVLNSESHIGIRKLTGEYVKPILIGRLGSYVFDNAFVDACILVASPRTMSENANILWTSNVADATPKALRELRRQQITHTIAKGDDYSIYPVRQADILQEDSWMPMSYDSNELKTIFESKIKGNKLSRISDLFDVRQGARTGLNKVFIITSKQYEELPSKEKKYFRPSVDSASLRNGVLDRSNYVFFPYTAKLKELNTEDDLIKHIPNFYNNVLLVNKSNLIKRTGIDSGKWWLLTRPRDWQKQIQSKLVSTEFGKAGNFSFDETGEYVVERGCAWFSKDPDFTSDYYFAYVAILNSTTMNKLLKIYSKQLAGGSWYALDTKNIGKIPIPDFTKEEFADYCAALIDFGLRIIRQEAYDKKELDVLISQIYAI